MRAVCALLLLSAVASVHAADGYARIPGGSFASVLPAGRGGGNTVSLPAYRLARQPVSNAEFAAFLRKQPQWRRDRIASLFADAGYLRHWPSAAAPSAAQAPQPVTQVSWFAATAYCEAQGARLPTWYEWEYAAAADETRRDARDDPAWRQRILDWYARPNGELASVGSTPPNVYGVRDLHGLIWEWVQDAGALIVNVDSRSADDADRLKFCGSGALTMEQKENYAVLMRVAMLSSLQASYSTANLGFRCARDDVGGLP